MAYFQAAAEVFLQNEPAKVLKGKFIMHFFIS